MTNPIEKHIADSLEEFDQRFVLQRDISTNMTPNVVRYFWDGLTPDGGFPYKINKDGLAELVYAPDTVRDFLNQSLLQLLEIAKGEVEKLEAPYQSEYDLESVHEGYFKAIQDVLDTLTITEK